MQRLLPLYQSIMTKQLVWKFLEHFILGETQDRSVVDKLVFRPSAYIHSLAPFFLPTVTSLSGNPWVIGPTSVSLSRPPSPSPSLFSLCAQRVIPTVCRVKKTPKRYVQSLSIESQLHKAVCFDVACHECIGVDQPIKWTTLVVIMLQASKCGPASLRWRQINAPNPPIACFL